MNDSMQEKKEKNVFTNSICHFLSPVKRFLSLMNAVT